MCGAIATPAGSTNEPPVESNDCAPVIGSTRKTCPVPPNASKSVTMMSPLPSIATPFGSTKEPPEEMVVCAPVVGSTFMTPPGPKNASGYEPAWYGLFGRRVSTHRKTLD